MRINNFNFNLKQADLNALMEYRAKLQFEHFIGAVICFTVVSFVITSLIMFLYILKACFNILFNIFLYIVWNNLTPGYKIIELNIIICSILMITFVTVTMKRWIDVLEVKVNGLNEKVILKDKLIEDLREELRQKNLLIIKMQDTAYESETISKHNKFKNGTLSTSIDMRIFK